VYDKFHFKEINFSLESGEVEFGYAVDEVYEFTEKFKFPDAPFVLSENQKKALAQVLRYWHLAAGISYYKAFLPDRMVTDIYKLTKDEAEFFRKFYINGLGEFAVRNNLHFFDKISFPYSEDTNRQSFDVKFKDEVLVPIGGGKDSCLALELLKNMNINAAMIACGYPKPIAEVMDRSGKQKIIVKRQIAPELLQLNESGQVYNGHVPITGILAFMLWAAAIIYEKKYVVMSCERSASSGNMIYDGVKINHQYSKSFDFEKDFYELTQKITPEFRYFSLLRPISEIHIAKLFTQKCAEYFDVFTSCNKAFKLDENKRLNHWCGNCDKCRFVFLILAPFMEKQKLIKIVGKNPLDDATQLDGYRELLGISGHKPFECVGEFKESNWAFAQLTHNSEWCNDYVIKNLQPKIYKQTSGLFKPKRQHLIPERFKNVMAEFRK